MWSLWSAVILLLCALSVCVQSEVLVQLKQIDSTGDVLIAGNHKLKHEKLLEYNFTRPADPEYWLGKIWAYTEVVHLPDVGKTLEQRITFIRVENFAIRPLWVSFASLNDEGIGSYNAVINFRYMKFFGCDYRVFIGGEPHSSGNNTIN